MADTAGVLMHLRAAQAEVNKACVVLAALNPLAREISTYKEMTALMLIINRLMVEIGRLQV